MSGTLYICATPIGNLKDMTPRVAETLSSVDLIAAEDTRNSIKLLNHFEIKTSMTSYHEYNKVEKAQVLVQKMKEGLDVALITDAGTPAISDPGEVLVRLCQQEGITVTSLPGAAACITALTLSGLSTRQLYFQSILPKAKKEKEEIMGLPAEETRTMILYAEPHRLVRTLKELYEALGERKLTICRELTKKFETVMPTTLEGALAFYETEEPRGEYVLVIEGKSLLQIKQERQEGFLNLSIEEHMKRYEGEGMERKEAMKMVAKDRGISKREIYQYMLDK